MEQTSTQRSQTTNMSFNVEQYPLVQITRRFAAPVERVFEAWTTNELIKQWWGPETFTCPDARMDVREGGRSVLAMQGPDGKVQYSGSTYDEVIPNERLVMTDEFTDKNGKLMSANEAGMPGQWPDIMTVNIEFKSLGTNESQIGLIHEVIPREMHDDCVEGWSSSFNKLQRLVERS